jgi:hypothetical protein
VQSLTGVEIFLGVVDFGFVMFCPQCKAEYRQGFTRCTDCDVELVEHYVEAVRHPLAKKVAVGEKYGTRLWHGSDPHFYVGLLWSLWDKKVACYGVPEYPPVRMSAMRPQPSTSGPVEFEVWVSEENLPLAEWILESGKEEFEKEPLEERGARVEATPDEVSPETTGICPLCFGNFTAATANCPNCGVPLRSPYADVALEESAWMLCNLGHPKFITELRKALQANGIPFNNSNFLSGDIFSGQYRIPNYEVLVLKKDFERATQVMSHVLQHWEFEPSAGFRIGRDPFLDYGLELAAQKGWFPEDISTLIWSGENIVQVGGIGLALQEHKIAYRIETLPLGMANVFTHAEDETRAKKLVQEVVEGARPE